MSSDSEHAALTRLTDDLMELGDVASRFLETYERWSTGEDVSPYMMDRLRERALRLKRELKRLGLP